MKMKSIFLSLFFLSLLALPTNARNTSRFLTYADFSRVRNITVSISHVYFATTEGVTRYNKLEQQWEEPLTGADGVDYRNIFRVYVNQFDEKLFARTEFSTYEYDILFNSWYSISEIPQMDIEYRHVKPPQIMYAPTGFNYSASGAIIDQYSRDYLINDMVDDGSGTVWIGTWGYGAAMTESSSSVIELLPFGLLQNRVNSIYNDNGLLIMGGEVRNSYRTGITFFDPDINEFDYLESGVHLDFPPEDINCFESDDKYIYVGTSDGLFLISQEDLKVEARYSERTGLIDNTILSLKKNGDSLFIGTANGLNLLIGESDSLKIVRPNLFTNSQIFDFELTDSTIWIAAESGAFQMHLVTGELKQFQDPHLIIFSKAYNVEKWGDNMFIASDGGMVRLNLKTGKTTPYISQSSGYRYRALAVNDDIAIIGTDLGFSLFYLNEKGYENEREFTVGDGLPSDRIFSLLLDGDFLWIGSDLGLTKFWWNDPHRID